MITINYNKETEIFDFKLFDKCILGSTISAYIGKEKAKLMKIENINDSDKLGVYSGYKMLYQDLNNNQFTAIIKKYSDFIIFKTINHFNILKQKDSDFYGDPYVTFPCFEGEEWEDSLSVLTYKRNAPFNYPEQYFGKVINSFREGKHVPLFITNQQYETVILSPLDNLLYGTVSINHDKNNIQCGLPASLQLNKEVTHSTILVYGNKVSDTIIKWGNLLQRYYETPFIKNDDDIILKKISYWTNAGAKYWYNTHKNEAYDETLLRLYNHHKQIELEIGCYQLDSWWYQRENLTYTAGIMDYNPYTHVYCKNFNSIHYFSSKYKKLNIFKNNTMESLQSQFKVPFTLHYKQIAKDAVYVKNNPEDFIIDYYALPKNYSTAKKLFKKLFDKKDRNIAIIMHDWLSWMSENHHVFHNFNFMRDYFKALDDVVSEMKNVNNNKGNTTIQFCMTKPDQTLNSVTMKNVTTIRSTSDANSFFIEGPKRWYWHIYSSVLIQAIGKYPFIDNRFTNQKHLFSRSQYSELEAILISLSCGPYGIADEIGQENLNLIKKVVINEGILLKPDKPAWPLDKCYLYNPYDSKCREGITVYSNTLYDNNYSIYYLLSFNCNHHRLSSKIVYNFDDFVKNNNDENFIVYDLISKQYKIVDRDYIFKYYLKLNKFVYNLIAPLKNDIAFLGNINKYIPSSKKIFNEIKFIDRGIIIDGNNIYKNEIGLYIKETPSEIKLSYQVNDLEKTIIIDDYKYHNHILLICFKDLKASSYQIIIKW